MKQHAPFVVKAVLPLLVLALLTWTPLRAAQQVEVIPVQGSVYMLQFSRPSELDVFASTRGGNIGVLPGPDGVTVWRRLPPHTP